MESLESECIAWFTEMSIDPYKFITFVDIIGKCFTDGWSIDSDICHTKIQALLRPIFSQFPSVSDDQWNSLICALRSRRDIEKHKKNWGNRPRSDLNLRTPRSMRIDKAYAKDEPGLRLPAELGQSDLIRGDRSTTSTAVSETTILEATAIRKATQSQRATRIRVKPVGRVYKTNTWQDLKRLRPRGSNGRVA